MVRTAVVLVLVAGSLVSGCSSGGGGSDLDKALSSVADTAQTRAYVEFGRVADANAAGQDDPYRNVAGFGLGTLAAVHTLIPAALGFEPMTAGYAVTAGRPPEQGTLLAGVALKNADSALAGLGATTTKNGGA